MARKFFEDPDFENDDEQPVEAPPTPVALQIIGKIIKYAFWALILFVNVLLFWRLFSTGLPSDMKTIYVDGELEKAYAAWQADTSEDKGDFAIFQKYWQKHNMTTTAKDEENGIIGNYGYFGVADAAIFPTAGQVQFIFRYNFSTLDHLKEDYSLNFDPAKESEWYDVTLRVVTDATPDNKEDDATEEKRFECTLLDGAEKNVYCYRRYYAKGLTITENTAAVYVDVYYKDDVDYGREAYGSICIYSDDQNTKAYGLDKNDKKALAGE